MKFDISKFVIELKIYSTWDFYQFHSEINYTSSQYPNTKKVFFFLLENYLVDYDIMNDNLITIRIR